MDALRDPMPRRSFLRFMAAGTAAMAFAPGRALARAGKSPKAKSVILLWMGGGPSQLDTFDPKPGVETGGEFRAIDTPVRGMRVAEVLPRVAAQGKQLSIIRTLTTREAAHDRATHLLHTGYEPIQNLEFAPLGTVVSSETAEDDYPLPTFIALSPPAIPRSRVFGVRHLPFTVENVNDPIPNIGTGVTGRRAMARDQLLAEQDGEFREDRRGAALERAKESARKAADLMTTPLLEAFDLKKEPEEVRARYGKGFGEKCLLARRLAAAGVPFVEVGLGGWDNHANVCRAVRRNCEQLDRGMGALLADLARTGQLDETLVLWMGEFGRTPRINGRKGRDHWSRSFAVALAAGGVEGGRVVGRTDRLGMEIVSRPVTPEDLFTTIYHTLGIDPDDEYVTEERSVRYGGSGGKVIRELF